MPVPLVLLSEGKRRGISVVSSVLCMLCLPGSLIFIGIAIYMRMAVEDKVRLIENFDTTLLPVTVGVAGIVCFMQSVLAGGFMLTVQKVKKRPRLACCSISVVLSGFLTFVWLLLVTILCFLQISKLKDSFSKGITAAMGRYMTDQSIKEELDLLQLGYSCCGSKGHKDWFKTAWVDKHSLAAQVSGERVALPAEYKTDDVPFSCCDPKAARPCIHLHVLNALRHYNYDPDKTTTLHKRGCTDALMEGLGKLMTGIGAGMAAATAIQLVNLILLRLMETSVSRAVKSGDFERTTNGWLFSLPGKQSGAEKGEEAADEETPLLGVSTTSGEGSTEEEHIYDTIDDAEDKSESNSKRLPSHVKASSPKKVLGPRPDQTLPPLPTEERNTSNKRMPTRPQQEHVHKARASHPSTASPPSRSRRGLPYSLSSGGSGTAGGSSRASRNSNLETPAPPEPEDDLQPSHRHRPSWPTSEHMTHDKQGSVCSANDRTDTQPENKQSHDANVPTSRCSKTHEETSGRSESQSLTGKKSASHNTLRERLYPCLETNHRHRCHHEANNEVKTDHQTNVGRGSFPAQTHLTSTSKTANSGFPMQYAPTSAPHNREVPPSVLFDGAALRTVPSCAANDRTWTNNKTPSWTEPCISAEGRAAFNRTAVNTQQAQQDRAESVMSTSHRHGDHLYAKKTVNEFHEKVNVRPAPGAAAASHRLVPGSTTFSKREVCDTGNTSRHDGSYVAHERTGLWISSVARNQMSQVDAAGKNSGNKKPNNDIFRSEQPALETQRETRQVVRGRILPTGSHRSVRELPVLSSPYSGTRKLGGQAGGEGGRQHRHKTLSREMPSQEQNLEAGVGAQDHHAGVRAPNRQTGSGQPEVSADIPRPQESGTYRAKPGDDRDGVRTDKGDRHTSMSTVTEHHDTGKQSHANSGRILEFGTHCAGRNNSNVNKHGGTRRRSVEKRHRSASRNKHCHSSRLTNPDVISALGEPRVRRRSVNARDSCLGSSTQHVSCPPRTS